MEYTQENALDILKDLQSRRQREINQVEIAVANNAANPVDQSCTAEDVTRKQQKFYRSLYKHVTSLEPTGYLTPRTSALHAEVLHEMNQEIKKMKSLEKTLKARLSSIKEDIAGLEKKINGLREMRQMHLNVPRSSVEVDEKSLMLKQATTKKLFKEVKADLHMVVETLFPSNDALKEVLADLTHVHESDDNQGYVKVTPETLQPISFLIEAGIVQFKKNDKTMIKVCDA